jgi:pimeloyl-ACP methyl ester carboxylesterase
MNHQAVSVPFGTTLLKGDLLGNPQLIILHGAGQATSRKNFSELRNSMLERQVGSAALDFIGHGETGGQLLGSSLQSRTAQSIDFIKNVSVTEPLSLLGSSMSGYTAVRLTEFFNISSLILLVPAMYDRAAYTTPFGSEFSEIVRKPASWNDSDAWEILKKFKGHLLVISAELDEVIPFAVVEKIIKSAVSAASVQHKVIESKGHKGVFENNTQARNSVADLITKLIRP